MQTYLKLIDDRQLLLNELFKTKDDTKIKILTKKYYELMIEIEKEKM